MTSSLSSGSRCKSSASGSFSPVKTPQCPPDGSMYAQQKSQSRPVNSTLPSRVMPEPSVTVMPYSVTSVRLSPRTEKRTGMSCRL